MEEISARTGFSNAYIASHMSLLEKKIVEEYLKLPDKMRGDLMEFLEKAVREVKEESR